MYGLAGPEKQGVGCDGFVVESMPGFHDAMRWQLMQLVVGPYHCWTGAPAVSTCPLRLVSRYGLYAMRGVPLGPAFPGSVM